LDSNKVVDEPDKLVVITARAMVCAVTQFGASISQAIQAVDANLQVYLDDLHCQPEHEVRWDVFKATWKHVSSYYAPATQAVDLDEIKWTYSGSFVDARGVSQTVCDNLRLPKGVKSLFH